MFATSNVKSSSFLGKAFLLASVLFVPLLLLAPGEATAYGGYCDGHRDGHRAYYESEGRGYPGYRGCPGDPGSRGGNATPYERGFRDGMLVAAAESRGQY